MDDQQDQHDQHDQHDGRGPAGGGRGLDRRTFARLAAVGGAGAVLAAGAGAGAAGAATRGASASMPGMAGMGGTGAAAARSLPVVDAFSHMGRSVRVRRRGTAAALEVDGRAVEGALQVRNDGAWAATELLPFSDADWGTDVRKLVRRILDGDGSDYVL